MSCRLAFEIPGGRLRHITVGDATGGGQMDGAPGDGSKFPAGWGAAEISAAILAVAPTIAAWAEQPNGNWRGTGVHGASGIAITVICFRVQHPLTGNWQVVTAWPG